MRRRTSLSIVVVPFPKSSGHHSLRHFNCHCCTIPITTEKKMIQLSVRCCAIPIRTEKKKIQLSGHHSLRRSNCHCCAVPITTRKKYSRLSVVKPFQIRPGKKRYSHLAIICCAVPIAIVAPFQLRPEKKDTVVCPLLHRSKYDRKKKTLKK